MELTARDWDRVHAIARDLAIGVDRNELGKVVTYFRLHRNRGKFLTLIERLSQSDDHVRSSRTRDYFKRILQTCRQYLGNVEDQRALLMTGWAFRLMTYYAEGFGAPSVPLPFVPPKIVPREDLAEDWKHSVRAIGREDERPLSDFNAKLCRMLRLEVVSGPYPMGESTIGWQVRTNPDLNLRLPATFALVYVFKERFVKRDLETIREYMLGTMRVGDNFFGLLVTSDPYQELRRLATSESVYGEDFVVIDNNALDRLSSETSPSSWLRRHILEQVDLTVVSPYASQQPVDPSFFFGRELQIKRILRGLESGDFAVVGNRRIGKSSLLRKLESLLSVTTRYQPLRLDCQDVTDRDRFLRKFSMETQTTVRDLMEFAEVMTGNPSIRRSRQPILLLDEVDDLLRVDALGGDELVFRTFRSLAAKGNAHFVFCGFQTLHQRIHHPDSPLFNFCEEIILGPLTTEETRELIEKPMRSIGVLFAQPEGMVRDIIEWSSCHPHLTQYICERLLGVLQKGAREIRTDDLRRVLTSAEFRTRYEETAWGKVGTIEKLIALLMMDSTFFTAGQVYARFQAEQIRVSPQETERALDVLLLSSILLRTEGQYRFLMTKLPEILKQTKDMEFLVESLKAERMEQ